MRCFMKSKPFDRAGARDEAKAFAVRAQKKFAKEGWTYYNKEVGFKELATKDTEWLRQHAHVPDAMEINDQLIELFEWYTKSDTPTDFGLAGARLRIRPLPNSQVKLYEFQVYTDLY